MTRAKPLPSQAELQELFDYRDGKLYWRQSRGRQPAGSEAGTPCPNGYVNVYIDGRNYKRHRLVYALLVADPCDLQVDHINNRPGDDCIENLRLADNRKNAYNCHRRSDNKSGHKGVSWYTPYSKWRAVIQLPHRKQRHLGYFPSKSDAINAYRQAALALHGEFARFS